MTPYHVLPNVYGQEEHIPQKWLVLESSEENKPEVPVWPWGQTHTPSSLVDPKQAPRRALIGLPTPSPA